MLEQCCQRFWHNYVAAKDALRVFLSMRIKRLLKFIDITDSIKLCLAPLPHHTTLCYCPRACIACLCFASCVFFFVAFSLFSFLFSAFFMLYFVSDVAMAANFPCRQWQRPMTGSKIGNAKSSDDDGDVNCDGSSNSDRACAAGRGRGREGEKGGWFAAQTQFAWKILLVAVHVLNIIHSRQKNNSSSNGGGSAL